MKSIQKPFFQIIVADDNVAHVSQIIAGFQILKDKGKIDFSFNRDSKYIKSFYPHLSIVELKHNNLYYAFDLGDGYQSMVRLDEFDKMLDRVVYYFKRSSTRLIDEKLRNGFKIIPLGLNYWVTTKNSPFDKYINKYSLTGISLITDYIYYLKDKIVNKPSFFYSNFERDMKLKSNDLCNVLFFTRVWDPSEISVEGIRAAYPILDEEEAFALETNYKNDFLNVTQERIEILFNLKKNFGSRFQGGISDSKYARKLAPELILDENESSKFNFVKKLKLNNICVSTKGLHGSIGWKFGEYVAAHKAIVSDKLLYDVPGNFCSPTNYLQFNTIDELINNVQLLIDDKVKRTEMELANYSYYHESLRPDSMVINALKKFVEL